MLRRVALVRTHVSEELSASFIRVTGIGELGTTLAVTSNRRTHARSVRRNIPEDNILHFKEVSELRALIEVPRTLCAQIGPIQRARVPAAYRIMNWKSKKCSFPCKV
jgi:hypothetical protein